MNFLQAQEKGYFELIDGQRRLEALKELGWKKVSIEIQEVDDKKARIMSKISFTKNFLGIIIIADLSRTCNFFSYQG
jgi:hypothetical protein